MNTTIKNLNISDTLFAQAVIKNDDHAESPRSNGVENLGTMVLRHPKFNFGDDAPRARGISYNENLRDLGLTNENCLMLPIYMMDHGSISISLTPFNDSWDSWLSGFIYVKNEDVIENFGEFESNTVDLALNVLAEEVKEYNSFINNEVYGFNVAVYERHPRADVKDFSTTRGAFCIDNSADSCWGFYDEGACIREADAALQTVVKGYENGRS